MHTPDIHKISELVAQSQRIVIIQADNPDADSLATALALEEILGDMGKYSVLYCSADMPVYLRYLPGWDRVTKELPTNFDMSIIVDASTETLIDNLRDVNFRGSLATRPCVVLDHHAIVQDPIVFAEVAYVDSAVSSTGELVYNLATSLSWEINTQAKEHIVTAILGDTQGLTNDLTTPHTYRVVADLVEQGVDRIKLEERRREFGKMPEPIFRYKAALITRTELYADGALAVVSIPQAEINEYSPLYNPAPLVQGDHLQTAGVQVSIVLKQYDSGRVTAALRANHATPIANKIAERMGGGGHAYAAGFKIEDGRPFNEVKSECIRHATELLTSITEQSHESL